MTTESKRGYASSFEANSEDLHLQSKIRILRMVDGARVGLTVLALSMGITILGVSGDALAVYDTTHVPHDFLLPLWPDQFNLRPTVALVVGSAIVVVANAVSLLFSKVQSLRGKVAIHTSLTFAAPLVGLIAAIIAMVFFYAVNASATNDTLLSWTCRWKAVPMLQRPHFDTLCKESWAGLYMSILLVPVEALVLAVAVWQMKQERHTNAYVSARKGAPTMS